MLKLDRRGFFGGLFGAAIVPVTFPKNYKGPKISCILKVDDTEYALGMVCHTEVDDKYNRDIIRLYGDAMSRTLTDHLVREGKLKKVLTDPL